MCVCALALCEVFDFQKDVVEKRNAKVHIRSKICEESGVRVIEVGVGNGRKKKKG